MNTHRFEIRENGWLAIEDQTPETGLKEAEAPSRVNGAGHGADGSLGATGMSRVLQSLLFGVGATDAVTYAGMGGFLALAALVACWAPACAALKLDPVAVLKEE